MNNILLVITITAYITSIAGCLILSIALKNISLSKLKLPLFIHTILIVVFCVVYMFNNESAVLHYLMLAFVCSGLMLSGLVLRSGALIPFKIYFSIFLISIVFFLVSPSHLFRYISYSWRNNDLFQTFHLQSNYFLEEQQAMLNIADNQTKYKVIQSFGVFHKTLARDIDFGSRLDSVHIISFNQGNAVTLRGYFSKISATFENLDSVDIKSVLGEQTEKIIRKNSNSK